MLDGMLGRFQALVFRIARQYRVGQLAALFRLHRCQTCIRENQISHAVGGGRGPGADQNITAAWIFIFFP